MISESFDVGSVNPQSEIPKGVRAYSTISIRLPVHLRSAIDERSISRGISSSELARSAIEKELGIRNGFWIDLPDAVTNRLETDVESGLFINIEEAIRYYPVKCLRIEDAEVLG